MAYQNVWDAVKAVLIRKCIVWNLDTSKLYLKEAEKRNNNKEQRLLK